MIIIKDKIVDDIFNIFEENSFNAWLIGGVVRDFLLGGKECFDIDIITDAVPREVKSLLEKIGIFDVSENFGCVNFNHGKYQIEITTLRKEGNYTDLRRPDKIEFIKNIHEDLPRRDFTVNAIAYNKNQGFIDDFNGFYDLKNELLRTIGDPFLRFKEDALRILRALRFLSSYNLSCEEKTASAIFSLSENIKVLSKERILKEFSGIVNGQNSVDVFLQFKDVIFKIVGELEILTKYSFESGLSFYDFASLMLIEGETPIEKYFFLLFLLNAEIARNINKKVDYSFNLKEILKNYILNKTTRNSLLKLFDASYLFFDELNDIKIKKAMEHLDNDLKTFISVFKKFAFMLSMNSKIDITKNAEHFETRCNEILKNNEFYCRSQLAINGDDLKNMGFNGREIAEKLNVITLKIIDGKLKNNKDSIIEYLGSENND